MEHKKLLGCFTLFSIFLCLNQNAEGWFGKKHREKKALKKIEKEAGLYGDEQVKQAYSALTIATDYVNLLSVTIEKTAADIKGKIDSINTLIQSKLQASDRVAFNRISKQLQSLAFQGKKQKMLNIKEKIDQLQNIKNEFVVFTNVYLEKAANYRNELGEIITLNIDETSKQFQKEKNAIQKLTEKYSKQMVINAYKAAVDSIKEIEACKSSILALQQSVTDEQSKLIQYIENDLQSTDLDAYNSVKNFVENLKSTKFDYDQATSFLKKINFELARRRIGYVNVATRGGYGDKLINQQTNQEKINITGSTSINETQKRHGTTPKGAASPVVQQPAEGNPPPLRMNENGQPVQQPTQTAAAQPQQTQKPQPATTPAPTAGLSDASHVEAEAPTPSPAAQPAPAQSEQAPAAGNIPPPPPLHIDVNGKPAAPVAPAAAPVAPAAAQPAPAQSKSAPAAGNIPTPPPLHIDVNGKPAAPVAPAAAPVAPAAAPVAPAAAPVAPAAAPVAPESAPIISEVPVVATQQSAPVPTTQPQFNMKEERAKKTESLHEVIGNETYLNTLVQKAPDLLVERMSYTTKADLLKIPAKIYKDLIAKLTPVGVKINLRPASLPQGNVGKPESGARIITMYAMHKVLSESYKDTARSLITAYGTGKNMVQGLTNTFNRAGQSTFEKDMKLAELAPDDTFDSSSDKTWAINDTTERETWKLKANQLQTQANATNKPSVGTGKVWKKKQIDTSGMDFTDILKKGMAERGIERIQ